jgi:hypothetical protein
VLAKISTDLAWRGPNGSSARYVVLERDAAEALLDPIDERALLSEIFRLVGLLNDAVWIEEYEPGQFAVNIVALDPGQPARTMQ